MNYQIFARRIREAKFLSKSFFIFHFFSMLLMRFFLNFLNYNDYSLEWVLIIVTENAFLITYWAVAQALLPNRKTWMVLALAAVFGLTRTYISTQMGITFRLENVYGWEFLLLTGTFFEICLILVWANVNRAWLEHNQVVSRLRETQNTILGYRENAVEILNDEQDSLMTLTQQSLLPQIQLLETAIEESDNELASRWTVANELKAVIYNQVRPLSESLQKSAKKLQALPQPSQNQMNLLVQIPPRFKLANSIFPVASFSLMFLTFFGAPYWLLDSSWILPSVGFSVIYFGILALVKKLVSGWPEVSAWFGVPALALLAVLGVLPVIAAAKLWFPDAEQANLYSANMMVVSIIVVMSLAYLDSLDYAASRYRKELEEQNIELSHEAALFEQQLWTVRRSWSLVIHGTVQASLTAALTRLNSADADAKTLQLAKEDLDRAIHALTSPPALEMNFETACQELVLTWRGVCDINLAIALEVQAIISSDNRLTMCVNEILKEAVSNAVRHGDARQAWVSINNQGSGILDLAVANDGAPPSTRRRGLGAGLMDELTVDWTLGFDKITNRTILRAHLPFSIAQA